METATVSGTVREAGSQAAIAGATVAAGVIRATTTANGQFSLPNVPIGGSLPIVVTAEGFDTYTQTIAVQAGQNSHDVTLTRNPFYAAGNNVMYLPPGISTYRGVIFDVPGGTVGDSRPLVRGDLAFYQAIPLYGDVAGYRQFLLSFAATQHFAVLGTAAPNEYDDILTTLVSVANQSGHPELAYAPLVLYGHSLGGCAAYGFTRLHSERVIGLISSKSGCHTMGNAAGAISVPVYLLIGEADDPSISDHVMQLFDLNRSLGAPWAVAVFPGEDHTRTSNFSLIFNWLTAVVAGRLPAEITPGQPVPLLPVDAASGWLANRSTGTIACYACYTDPKSTASWFPSEQTARDWRELIVRSDAAVRLW